MEKSFAKMDHRLQWIGRVAERMLNVPAKIPSTFCDLLTGSPEGAKFEKCLQNLCDGLSVQKPVTPTRRSTITWPQMVHKPRPTFNYVWFYTTAEEIEIEEITTKVTRIESRAENKEANQRDEMDDVSRPPSNQDADGAARTSKASSESSAHGSLQNLDKIETANSDHDAGNVSVTPTSRAGADVDGDDEGASVRSMEEEEIKKVTMKRRVYRIVLHMDFAKTAPPGVGVAMGDVLDVTGSRSKLLYLIRTTDGRITKMKSAEEANLEMPTHFELDFGAGDEPSDFFNILSNLYLPFLERENEQEYVNLKSNPKTDVLKIMNLPHRRLLLLQETIGDTFAFKEYLSSPTDDIKFYLHLPEDVHEEFLECATSPLEPKILDKLESICCDWKSQIESALTSLHAKLQASVTPIDEVKFWISTRLQLGDVLPELETERVTAVLSALHGVGRTGADQFDFHYEELRQFHHQSIEIARYMHILKPHFVVLEQRQSFVIVQQTISKLMPMMRLIWSISKYYNTAEKMAPLMQRVAVQLGDIVQKEIFVKDLLSSDAEIRSRSKLNSLQAGLLLEEWKKCYLDARASNSFSGQGQVPPWEFDRKRLFERTDYLALVCHNLFEVYEVMEQFENTMIPDLEAAFYGVDAVQVLRANIGDVPRRVFEMNYDPLDVANGDTWKCTMEHFRREVAFIDDDFQRVFDDGFARLRSTRAALQLLRTIGRAACRPAIKAHCSKKTEAVAQKLIDEINDIQKVFKAQMIDPPLYKNHPPVASAIYWSRRLLKEVQPTVDEFLKVTSTLNTKSRDTIITKFSNLTTAITESTESKFQVWSTETQSSILSLLREPLIRKIAGQPKRNGNSFPYEVNFPQTLSTLISEAKHLEHLGFTIPLKIRLLVIQESEYARKWFLLKSIVFQGRSMSSSTNDKENLKFQELKSEMDRGCLRLNWMTLSIDVYINKLNCLIG